MARVMVLHGPNLNLLGTREPEIYGAETLEDVNAALTALGAELGVEVECRQSNDEGELVSAIQAAGKSCDYLIANLAAYTHTSIALMDAIKAVAIPTIEVHISNTHAREEYRHKSYIAPVVEGRIEGLGTHGYLLALRHAARKIAAKGGKR
ncbi:MAG: type II 3-dehydroquinate dehydratase [Deltaproteobacteria bacterium]|nr:type II 3-dehydroquinate dehydratase [bacterium]MCB9479449.1 type II 3-dehydroquinate dehydratase [Deltaproteobacteria bacterium]MCB9488593.1 type II 3-dehydroquinate dehydratase [Deltaproteobacteria bacterium]